jgi:hypothetical protein
MTLSWAPSDQHLMSASKQCSRCGRSAMPTWRFCTGCATPFHESCAVQAGDSRTAQSTEDVLAQVHQTQQQALVWESRTKQLEDLLAAQQRSWHLERQRLMDDAIQLRAQLSRATNATSSTCSLGPYSTDEAAEMVRLTERSLMLCDSVTLLERR